MYQTLAATLADGSRLVPLRQELRADQPPVDGVPDARVSTVTPGSQRLLERVGAWQHCAPAVAAFSDMQVRAFSEIRFT